MFEYKIDHKKNRIVVDSSGHTHFIGFVCLIFGLIPTFFFCKSLVRDVDAPVEYYWFYPILFMPFLIMSIICFFSRMIAEVDRNGSLTIKYTTCGFSISSTTFQVSQNDVFSIRKRIVPWRYSTTEYYFVVVHLSELSQTMVIAKVLAKSEAEGVEQQLNSFLNNQDSLA